jgi:hypothetical protein
MNTRNISIILSVLIISVGTRAIAQIDDGQNYITKTGVTITNQTLAARKGVRICKVSKLNNSSFEIYTRLPDGVYSLQVFTESHKLLETWKLVE